ncbi:hypothetical protein [Streptomyces sp. NPDC001914]|uniref:hypothetical protein n=1 Tax=Streptomyces sp. NPDC001914 TaxID=3364623 RepID=UPI003688B4D9
MLARATDNTENSAAARLRHEDELTLLQREGLALTMSDQPALPERHMAQRGKHPNANWSGDAARNLIAEFDRIKTLHVPASWWRENRREKNFEKMRDAKAQETLSKKYLWSKTEPYYPARQAAKAAKRIPRRERFVLPASVARPGHRVVQPLVHHERAGAHAEHRFGVLGLRGPAGAGSQEPQPAVRGPSAEHVVVGNEGQGAPAGQAAQGGGLAAWVRGDQYRKKPGGPSKK